MEHVVIMASVLLIQYQVFGMLVGKARGTYNVPAPETSGDPIFNRYYRVHQNTLEQLVIFIPAMFMYALFGDPNYAAGAGLVFFIGRILYLRSYIADPGSRTIGFLTGFAATAFVLIGSIVVAIRSVL